MSQENVESVRRGWEHWKATGEFRGDPDLVWDVTKLGWPGRQVYAGPEGASEFLAEWGDAWDDWELEVEDYIDAGDTVVTIVNQSGKAKGTEVPVEMRFAQVWTFRDTRAVRMELYGHPEEALEALGLSA
jgi:ketosteroid isomerase-like protein